MMSALIFTRRWCWKPQKKKYLHNACFFKFYCCWCCCQYLITVSIHINPGFCHNLIYNWTLRPLADRAPVDGVFAMPVCRVLSYRVNIQYLLFKIQDNFALQRLPHKNTYNYNTVTDKSAFSTYSTTLISHPPYVLSLENSLIKGWKTCSGVFSCI